MTNTEKRTGKKKVSKYKKKLAEKLRKLKTNFLTYYSKLPIQKLAAESIGVHENTVINWKIKDKKFCDQTTSAKSQWALVKVDKVKSVEWLLERVMKDHFAEKKELELGASEDLKAFLDRVAERHKNP